MSELEPPVSEFELDDESGPVSPRFQWSVHAVASGDRVQLRSRGTLLGSHDRELVVDAAVLDALAAELDALGLVDLVDEARAGRVGTRVNTLRVGPRGVRYLPSDVDERRDATDTTRPLRAARARVLAFLRDALQNT